MMVPSVARLPGPGGPLGGRPQLSGATQDTLARHLEELVRSAAAQERRAAAASQAAAAASGGTGSGAHGGWTAGAHVPFLLQHDEGDRHLLEYLEAEARDLSPEAFSRLMAEAYNRVAALLQRGNDSTRKLAGVLAVQELIDVKSIGDDAAKSARLAALLGRVLDECEDPGLAEAAAHVLGHLVRHGGAMTSDVVEREVRRAIVWCDPRQEPSEFRRLTAVLLLRELAEQAPAVFNVHVKSFIDAIWYPLRDARLHVREAAVAALQACLVLVEKRETRYRVQWYYKLFEATMRGMMRDSRTYAQPTPETTHGSLLALGELLEHTGEFLLARYKEVVEGVFRYKDAKDKHVKRAVLALLPRMAAFSPERFASEYLGQAMALLLTIVKNPAERGAAFTALGETAQALARYGCVSPQYFNYNSLREVAIAIKEAVSSAVNLKTAKAGSLARHGGYLEALQCVGTLAAALGETWRPFVQELVPHLVMTGVSENLVSALTQVTEALPGLLPDIQAQLLDLLSLVLAKRPFSTSTHVVKSQALMAAIAQGDLQGSGLIRLALQTLGTFDFGGIPLLEFMRDHILQYTEDPDKELRRAAVLAVSRVLERHAAAAPSYSNKQLGSLSSSAAAAVWHTRVVERVVARLLAVSVADPSERVRLEVLRALASSTALDEYLAQADALRALLMAMNDESCSVRALALALVGRLAGRNPAHTNPVLRRYLQQLLADMEHSPDPRAREEAAYLLECLIHAAPRLIMPYVSPICKALVGKLRGGLGGGLHAGSGGGGGTAGGLAVAGGGLVGGGPSVSTGGMVGSAPVAGVTLGGGVPSAAGGAGKDGVGGGGGVSGAATAMSNKAAKAMVREAIAENNVIKTVLSTLGQLANVVGVSFRPYVTEVLPLVIDAIQDVGDGKRRLVAVKTLGQIVESTGYVVGPYLEYPQLLAVLLRMLHEGNAQQRREVIKVLGIIGALDPHTHKTNQASLSGEGKLEKEGVRPLRHGQAVGGAGGGNGSVEGAGMGGPDDPVSTDLLPMGIGATNADDYYPTVAINALCRVLRDPGLSSQHLAVMNALGAIFRSLGLSAVPYLTKVLPVLISALRNGDDSLREEVLCCFKSLTGSVRQHLRRFLPDLLLAIHECWSGPSQRTCLTLLAELCTTLKDDFKQYTAELLPKFVGLFAEAERMGQYDMVRPALAALESLGSAAEDRLHLLLPALLRLVSPAASSTPHEIRRAALRTLRRLLPRMQQGGYATTVVHPLLKVLDGPHDELRRDALDALCALAVVMGPDFAIFVPTVRKAVARHRINHEWFERLMAKVAAAEPLCCCDAEDWESAAAVGGGPGGWAIELDLLQRLMADGQQGQTANNTVDTGVPAKLQVNAATLRRAWESSQRVTKEDWAEWMRHFSVELLKESPSPALRACYTLAQVHPSMARELFAAGFVSCWSELDQSLQEQLVRSLEAALASPTIPPEIVTALLNLAEFMEHDDKRLPLDTRTLGALAEKCHAFAKALHYKELEFITSPQTAIEALIHINNQLRQPEAAVGVLTYAQKHLNMELKESWYEKLCRWDEALVAYENRLHREKAATPEYQSALLGKMRCLAALAEWEQLSTLCRSEWRKSETHVRREMSIIAAHAAWHMGAWEEMAQYVDTVDPPLTGPSWQHSRHHTAEPVVEQHTNPLLINLRAGPEGLIARAGPVNGKAHGTRVWAGLGHFNTTRSGGPRSGGGVTLGQTATGAFLRAVLSVRNGNFEVARMHVERARELMSTDLAALVGESYERAYTDMVRVQQLAELEEVVQYKLAQEKRAADPSGSEARMSFVRQLWRDRLRGAQRHVEVWQSLFNVHHLVVPVHEDVQGWLKFAGLCRKSGRPRQSHRMLLQLLRYDPMTLGPSQPGYGAGSGAPHVMLAYLKHMWTTGYRTEAFSRIKDLVRELQAEEGGMPATTQEDAAAAAAAAATSSQGVAAAAPQPAVTTLDPATAAAVGLAPGTTAPISVLAGAIPAATGLASAGPMAGGVQGVGGLHGTIKWNATTTPSPPLNGRAYLRLGMWQWALNDQTLKDHPETVKTILDSLGAATRAAPTWAKAWHQWALFNVAVSAQYANDERVALAHVPPAVSGFFRSVALAQAQGDRTGNLQDILRILTLWFNYGWVEEVRSTLVEGFQLVSVDTWLGVIPQIIARIHTANPDVRQLIHQLLVRIGRHHPQALMYPLLVATKSQSTARRTAAFSVLDQIRTHSAALVEQAQLVSGELIRMAILWHEMWHEGLEEASRLYFGESNVEGMLATLLPLHDLLERAPPQTLKEIAFVQSYGRELSEAYEWLMKFKVSRKEAELHQAWDLYYHVFKRINKQLHSLTTLELQYVSPALVRAQGMELAVPGTYIAGEPLVTIAAFAPQLHVISSKQRPRKLTIHGGDGAEYMFLLKGHEDLRQDERVMQLFGLINSMLAADRATAERGLSIGRYAVIPLSPNSGLIGWVPNCDTLHALIREYRESRKIPLNWEHRLMLGMAPDYDSLPVIHKVEVFEYALESTSGEDLHKVLWLKSRSSEVWLDRRTNYTRSTAVMSMAGYILGLGDRHPSNLMLDRYSGKLLHIDFGDCFEASMNREKFPEKVPFRLTRMMVKAMEVAGIEGNFRSTCEHVMRVLRANKESVTAMLEAFVYDPLINWRLLNTADTTTDTAVGGAGTGTDGAGGGGASALGGQCSGGDGLDGLGGMHHSPPRRDTREKELKEHVAQLGDANEVLNTRAVEVMKRMSDKLMGRDYAAEREGLLGGAAGVVVVGEPDSVPAQVQRLISQAISHENLCQSYIGWCPFW